MYEQQKKIGVHKNYHLHTMASEIYSYCLTFAKFADCILKRQKIHSNDFENLEVILPFIQTNIVK